MLRRLVLQARGDAAHLVTLLAGAGAAGLDAGDEEQRSNYGGDAGRACRGRGREREGVHKGRELTVSL